MIAVEIEIVPKTTLCCLYIPSASSDKYLLHVLATIDSLCTDNNTILTADFMCTADINWFNLSASSSFSSSLCDTCSLYARNFQKLYLNQHIHGNLLDLVLSTNTNRLQNLTFTNVSSNRFKPDHHIIQFDVLSKSSLRTAKTSGSM